MGTLWIEPLFLWTSLACSGGAHVEYVNYYWENCRTVYLNFLCTNTKLVVKIYYNIFVIIPALFSSWQSGSIGFVSEQITKVIYII
jgi:hypothetical protein